jgi:hypothetical protein
MDGKRKYFQSNLQAAITELQSQSTKSILSVVHQYNVSEATLCYHLKNPDLFLYQGSASLFIHKKELAIVEHVN